LSVGLRDKAKSDDKDDNQTLGLEDVKSESGVHGDDPNDPSTTVAFQHLSQVCLMKQRDTRQALVPCVKYTADTNNFMLDIY